jgi:hypothetical protein
MRTGLRLLMYKGEIVRLRERNETAMIISSIEGDKAKCIWRVGEEMLSGEFTLEALEPVPAFEFIENYARLKIQ